MAITVDNDLNIVGYSVSEDATPLNPGDTNGGYGQLTYTLQTQEGSERRIDTETELYDDIKGNFKGTITNLNSNNGLLNVTADSELRQLGRWYSVKPFEGSLSAYLNRISSMVGLETPLTTNVVRTIRAPGFVGNVWDGFKQFLSANSLEITSDFEVRPIRTHSETIENVISESWNVDAQGTTELLEIFWYETDGWEQNVEVFPPLFEPFEAISVDANETVEQEYTIDGSLEALNQPEVVDYVAANTDFDGGRGAYCVAGSDGLPILADRWIASGGWLRVELTDNPSVIKVIVHGGKVEEYAPYRIAATAGSSSYYNSLHLTGTGFRWREKSLIMHTGAPRGEADNGETPTELKNINLMSADMAYTAALKAARQMNGAERIINGSAQTLGDTFGTPLGARIERPEAFFRVRSLSTGPTNVNYGLESDTTMQDFSDRMLPLTMSQFNAKYAGFRMMDFGAKPLQ